MRIVPTHRRKAISPVLATVILIAITLIAAIAIAGFVFGLFGTFTSTARVQASVTSCQADGSGGYYCTVVLSNSGNANGATTGSALAAGSCKLTYGGVSYTSRAADSVAHAIANTFGGQAVPSGGTVTVYCDNTAGPLATAGSQVTGSIILTNGGNALFSGIAS